LKNVFHYFKLHHSLKSEARATTVEPAVVQEVHSPASLPNERAVLTDIGGKRYRIASDDDYLETIKGVFEPDMVVLFDSLIKPDHVVLDIGANIGCTSILFANRARHVYSVEPSPSTFKYLEKNILAAQLGNITTANLGLGKAAGTYELTFSPNNRSGGFVSNRMSASDGHQVEQINIMKGDDFMKASAVPRVDFIKIDVEGFERYVIEGLGETMARDKPAVILELNHWCLNVFQRTSVPDFFDFLRNLFPYLYAVEKKDIKNLHDRNDAYHVMYHHIVGGFKYPNLVGAFNKDQLHTFANTFGLQIN
jgi:FkbM family methyltransferase